MDWVEREVPLSVCIRGIVRAERKEERKES